jgi:hypothetical protein
MSPECIQNQPKPVLQNLRHLLHLLTPVCARSWVQLTAEVFEELNNSRPELKAIHAGECASGQNPADASQL